MLILQDGNDVAMAFIGVITQRILADELLSDVHVHMGTGRKRRQASTDGRDEFEAANIPGLDSSAGDRDVDGARARAAVH